VLCFGGQVDVTETAGGRWEKGRREEEERNIELVRSCSALQTMVDRLIPHIQQRRRTRSDP
jgi:hypothetical protein